MALRRSSTSPPDKQMSFIGHLEEFRWHLIRSAFVVVIFTIVIFANLQWVMQNIILGPLQTDFITNRLLCRFNPALCNQAMRHLTLQATEPAEQFTRAILIAFTGGIVVAFPYLCWELWRFVKPGLHLKEMQNTRGIVFTISSLFLVGVVFGYGVVCPFTLAFFASFQISPEVQNIWRIGEVISLIVQISLAGGLLFEMPVLAYVLAKIGVLKAAYLRHFWKQAIIVILIVAGVLTPSPDVLSQMLLATPMFVLYFVSIGIAARVERKRKKTEEAELRRQKQLELQAQAEEVKEEG